MTAGGTPLGEFHDQLLAGGPIALPLLAEQAFGREAWDAVLTELLVA